MEQNAISSPFLSQVLIATFLLLIAYLLVSGSLLAVSTLLRKKNKVRLLIGKKLPENSEIFREIKNSMATIFIFALILTLTFHLTESNRNQVYFSIPDFGTVWFVFSILISLFLHDIYFYATHRLLHLPWFMKNVHHVHHQSVNPSPFAAFSFHPMEAFLQFAFLPIITLILPLHPIAIVVFFGYNVLVNILGHSGLEFFPANFMRSRISNIGNSPAFHHAHHSKGGNYGLYSPVWDQLFGTRNKITNSSFVKDPLEAIRIILGAVESRGAYPALRTVNSAPSAEIQMDGKNLIMFCTNNYLNLATNQNVIRAGIEAMEKFGSGAGGSRMISGTTSLHIELEKELAALKGREDSVLFSSGYMANLGVITSLANPVAAFAREMPKEFAQHYQQKTVILGDELNHASIIDAAKLAKAEYVTYRNADMNDLRAKAELYMENRLIIVSDGIFSMDGTIAPLPEIVAIAKQYRAITIIDDAHATGVIGKNGGGTAEYYGMKGQVDLEIGTLNKAMAGIGGFIAGNADICKFIRIASRTYIFSASMPPGVAGSLVAAVREIRINPEIRAQLFDGVALMCRHLKSANLIQENFHTPIIPVIIGNEEKCAEISAGLYQEGFFVPAIRWPAVPRGKARLRVTMMTEHTPAQIDRFAETLCRICRKHGIIRQSSAA